MTCLVAIPLVVEDWRSAKRRFEMLQGFSFQVSFDCPHCKKERFLHNCFKKIGAPVSLRCVHCGDSALFMHFDDGSFGECSISGAKTGRL